MPKSRMPSAVRVVKIGRLIKNWEMFIRRLQSSKVQMRKGRHRRNNAHRRARNQAKLPVRDHGISWRDAALNHDLVIDRLAQLDRPVINGLIRFDHKHELAGLPGLHRLRRNHRDVVQRPQGHHHVDKLSRPQSAIGIRKGSLELDRAGRVIHLSYR